MNDENNLNELTVNDGKAEAAVADLDLTDERSDEIKGGHGVAVLAWARVDGVSPR